MNKLKHVVPITARVLLGLIYFLSGLGGLFGWIQPPPDLPQPMVDFSTALMSTGYFFPFLKGTETVFGFFLVIRFVPAFALVVLAPITINIVLVHAFLTPGIQNLVLPSIMILFHGVAAFQYRNFYYPLFNRN